MKRLFTLIIAVLFCFGAMAGTVSGTVTKASTGNPAYPAITYLIKKSYDNTLGCYVLTLLDSTNTNSNGEYHFDSVTVSAGDLLVKAALTSANPDYVHYLPTYKENSLNWSTAHAVSFTLGANNIHLVHGTNAGGPGFVGGSVLMGANKPSGAGDPLPQREIIITTVNDDPVAYTFSDATGSFSFSGLSAGDYKLFGDVMGKQNPPLTITIDVNNPNVNNIIFEENSQSFTGHLQATGITQTIILNALNLYPNPTNDYIHLSIATTAAYTLSDMSGRVLMNGRIDKANNVVRISNLTSGIYLINISENGLVKNIKFVKE